MKYGRSFQNFHETFDVFVTLFRRQSSGRVNSKHNAAPRYVTRLYNRHKMETVTNRDLRLLLKTSVFASRITHHVIAGMHTRVEKLLHRHLPIDHHFICADSRRKGATILNCNMYLGWVSPFRVIKRRMNQFLCFKQETRNCLTEAKVCDLHVIVPSLDFRVLVDSKLCCCFVLRLVTKFHSF